MIKPRTALVALIGVAAALALSATASLAVTAFIDFDSWQKSSSEYRNGYAGGALDMLRALEDANVLGGAFAKQAHAVVVCMKDKRTDEVAEMYDDYMSKEPGRRGRSTASAIYNAIRMQCHVR
jgi:hypothetical protein